MRHGESEGNRDRVFTRTPEVPITEVGARQVRAAAEWLRGRYAPVRIVSSPYRRARQSAAIAGEVLGLEVVVEEDLRERSYGELAGRPYADALSLPGYDPAAWWDWCPPGGETVEEVAARAGAVLDRVARAAGLADVLVVSHGAVMRALWFHMTGAWGESRVARNAGLLLADHKDGAYRGVRPLDEAGGPVELERPRGPVE
jgi:broad specificity phosphatase PhoE